MRTIDRRTLLRGAGGAAIALPFLEIMGRPKLSLAQSIPGFTAAGLPKRFVVWFTPNGTIPQAWVPTGGETDFTFSRILKPLEPFRNKLLLVDGLDQTGQGGDGHQDGMQGMLTGQTLNAGPFKGAGFANGISVDQRVAQAIGGGTKFRSLELGVHPVEEHAGETNWNRMSLSGPGQPVPPEPSPYKAFERLFKDFSVQPSTGPSKTDERAKLMLNGVADNVRKLQAKLGAEDRARLEQHLQAVSELEGRLGMKSGGALPACAAPALGGEVDVFKNDAFPAVGKLQADLMAMALACDLTRVGSVMWNCAVGRIVHNWVDPSITRGHHDISHDGDSASASVEWLTKINVWYAQQFAYFLGKLDAIPEGDGTLLDNSVVLWCNELAKGNDHSRDNTHYVVAGGAQYFKMGRLIQFPYGEQVRHNNLLLSLVQSMGIEDTTFGKPDWCSGPLSRMVS